jgi:membrane protein implicated in regulation of membrane protease activity
MDPWVLWLVFGVVLVVAELFSFTAALGVLGGAALVTAGAAALSLPVVVQLGVFAVASIAGLLFVRPAALRTMRMPPLEQFGVDALAGRSAHVVREVTAGQGTVRISGEEWSAQAFDDSLVLPVGTTVTVMRISGATAYVYPKE